MAKQSNGSTGKKALKAGAGYTIGNICVRGISFISMPIFARLLTVEDYGIYNNFNAYINIFSIIIGFALHASIKNANIDFHGKVEEYSASASLLILFNAAAWITVFYIFQVPISQMLSLEQSFLAVLVVIESVGLALINYYNCYLAVSYRYKEYVLLSLVFAVLGIGLSMGLILTVFSDTRYMGRILGTLTAAVVVGIYILFRIYKAAKPKVNTEYWKYGLKISLPIIPHGLSQILLSQFDRIMIKRIRENGSAESGQYSFAYNIVTIYNVVASSLDTAWTQWFFDQMKDKNYDKIRKVANVYMLLMSAFSCGLYIISPELITILGGSKYNDARYVVDIILLAAYFEFMYYFPSSIEYYYKRTKLIAVGTMAAAGLNIVLNMIFIPQGGYIAAAYTTLVCYLMYYVLHLIFARHVHGNSLYDMKIQLGTVAFVSVFAFISLGLVDHFIIRAIIVAVMVVIALIVMYIYRNMIREVVQNYLAKKG